MRFWAVDYLAEVFVNGKPVGGHEGGEAPFVLDVTDAVVPGGENLLAVRVLNPTHEPIDGIVLNETPHRNKAIPYWAGATWNQGGIVDSVDLLTVPAVRVDDLFVRSDCGSGDVRVDLTVFNANEAAASANVELTLAPARDGATVDVVRMVRRLPPGRSIVTAELHADGARRWDLNDPFLYRVSARLTDGAAGSLDERSVRTGFRDFRFRDGYFRLNGRRIYLRCSHTGNCCPVGLETPHDPDLLRRDLLNVKAMGFNAIRFISGVGKRYQLDLCDEIGLLVYEESYAAWLMADSPQMARRYDDSVLGMVLRDRNHPSIAIWGLLNEMPDAAVFRHAVGFLPKLHAVDDSRMVMLNSGRWDLRHNQEVAGIRTWHNSERIDPCVCRNSTRNVVRGLGITWQPGQMSFHPGRNGEYGVVRWTAGRSGTIELTAAMEGIAERATTDVHVLHNGKPLFSAPINVDEGGNAARFSKRLSVDKGHTIDCAVGFGNGNYGADSTALSFTVKWLDGENVEGGNVEGGNVEGGNVDDAAAQFSIRNNPNGPWSYGRFDAGATPDAATFSQFDGGANPRIGSLSNPGSMAWEDVLGDTHPYQRVPHTAGVIDALRSVNDPTGAVFLSEYGIGSAVDLVRVVKLYEQLGKGGADDAVFYRERRDRFLADWKRWKMDRLFDRPEDYFTASLAKMAGQRTLGLNAIRANPNVVGYSLTGTVDQGMTGEGLTTTFREPKPGTFDAMFDGLAPLRWCLFVEPVNFYRGQSARVEVVLANEDALAPGKYPVRIRIVGPDAVRVLDRVATLEIPESAPGGEAPMVLPVFADDVTIDGPPGAYRLSATFERGAAAVGPPVEFHLDEPAAMPPVEADVVLWGQDDELARWLTERGIQVRPFDLASLEARRVILVSRQPAAPGGAAAFAQLARHVASGSTAVFLCPEVFAGPVNNARWMPAEQKGTFQSPRSWLYLKDEWAKRHPIFDGLPAGGLMDLTFYRELIPDALWVNHRPPAEAVAGAINAAQDYHSGLLVAVDELGHGRFIVNTLRIRDNLATHPAAERLLRNMLRFAARDAGQRPADLPDDFDTQLEKLGY